MNIKIYALILLIVFYGCGKSQEEKEKESENERSERMALDKERWTNRTIGDMTRAFDPISISDSGFSYTIDLERYCGRFILIKRFKPDDIFTINGQHFIKAYPRVSGTQAQYILRVSDRYFNLLSKKEPDKFIVSAIMDSVKNVNLIIIDREIRYNSFLIYGKIANVQSYNYPDED